MAPMRRTPLLLISALLLPCSGALLGCEALSKITGALTAAKDVAQHLDEDIKADLTDERLDKVLAVIPSLAKFSEEADVKWKPDPEAHDFTQLTNGIAGMNDYIAFFESHDTRLTQFYVDLMKTHDARAQILMAEGMDRARQKLGKHRKEIEAKLAGASAKERTELERQLDQVQRTQKRMEESERQAEEHRHRVQEANQQTGYEVSNEEVELVRRRLTEVNDVFYEYDYAKRPRAQAGNSAGPQEATSE